MQTGMAADEMFIVRGVMTLSSSIPVASLEKAEHAVRFWRDL